VRGGQVTRRIHTVLLSLLALMASIPSAAGLDWYMKQGDWQSTLQASLARYREGSLEGKDLRLSPWLCVGPFTIPDCRDLAQVFAKSFGPESEPADLAKTFSNGQLRWIAQPDWKDRTVTRISNVEFAAYYLTRTLTVSSARKIRVYLGSDDAITVWLNGQQVLAHLVGHWCAPDQESVDLDLKPGENKLVIKISNGVLDAAFYFSLQPNANTANTLAPLWDQIVRDFPAAAQQITWVREDNIFSEDAPARFYRYDDPQVTLRGRWQYTIAGSPDGFARRSDDAGAEATVDFIGDSISLLHKEGRLERSLILSRDAEQMYGLAAITLDGQPLQLTNAVARDHQGNSLIDTSRDARVVLARGLAPGPHRL
jgi:hypothetical protein